MWAIQSLQQLFNSAFNMSMNGHECVPIKLLRKSGFGSEATVCPSLVLLQGLYPVLFPILLYITLDFFFLANLNNIHFVRLLKLLTKGLFLGYLLCWLYAACQYSHFLLSRSYGYFYLFFKSWFTDWIKSHEFSFLLKW